MSGEINVIKWVYLNAPVISTREKMSFMEKNLLDIVLKCTAKY